MQNNKELVSVAVITFNSASTVLETLDSILFQEYGSENIELIISDDSSTDNTVMVINDWLSLNQSKFHNTIFIQKILNEGLPKNCNSAWKKASTNWIKTIAGDDILLKNCITDNMNFISDHKDVAVVFSLMDSFRVDVKNEKIYMNTFPVAYQQKILESSTNEQFNYLKKGWIGATPTAFLNKEMLRQINYADERFRLIEDVPLWFAVVKAGYRLSFLNKKTVLYRIGNSITYSKSRLVNVAFLKELILINKLVIHNDIKFYEFPVKIQNFIWCHAAILVAQIFNNRSHVVSRFCLKLVLLFKPFSIKYKMNRLIYAFSKVVRF